MQLFLNGKSIETPLRFFLEIHVGEIFVNFIQEAK